MSKELDYYDSEKTLPKKRKKKKGKFGIKLHYNSWNNEPWSWSKFYQTEKSRDQAYEDHVDYKINDRLFYVKVEKIER